MSGPRIGALRHRIVLEAAARAADGGGGAVVTWLAVAEVWASITPSAGAETIIADALSGRITHQILVRHRSDLVPAMRLRYGARLFEITAVLDVGERRRLSRCLCREELL